MSMHVTCKDVDAQHLLKTGHKKVVVSWVCAVMHVTPALIMKSQGMGQIQDEAWHAASRRGDTCESPLDVIESGLRFHCCDQH